MVKPGTRFLIVSPSFHDYDAAFKKAFESLGFEVGVVLYDHLPTVRDKIRNKLHFELPERFGRDSTEQRSQRSTRHAVAAVREFNPHRVLVIRGDILGDAFWSELEKRRIRYTVWFYDEYKRMRTAHLDLDRFLSIATYSSNDEAEFSARGLNVRHVPLGFDSFLKYAPRPYPDEVTFVGARYPNREAQLTSLFRAGVPVRAFGRDWSHDLRDRVRTWNRPRPDLPAGRDVNRAVAYGVMQGSMATLNVHFNQDGFTMRTFEASGVGAVQLVDRLDVARFYEPGKEVLVFSDKDELLEHCQRLASDESFASDLRVAAKRRTLSEHTLAHRAQDLVELIDTSL